MFNIYKIKITNNLRKKTKFAFCHLFGERSYIVSVDEMKISKQCGVQWKSHVWKSVPPFLTCHHLLHFLSLSCHHSSRDTISHTLLYISLTISLHFIFSSISFLCFSPCTCISFTIFSSCSSELRLSLSVFLLTLLDFTRL